MSLEHRIDGVLVNSRVRITGGGKQGVAGWPSAAWYCEPVTAGVIVDDPLGELDLRGWHVYTADETDCSKPRIFTGWLTARRQRRGDYRDGPAREWDCDIIDLNAMFSFECFRSSAASLRPAETDVARVQACIASHAMGGTPIFDNGRLSTADPRNLSASNFVAQYPVDMLNNAAGQSGKNVYAYWDDVAEQPSIHYDHVGTGPAAGIEFSNVMADVDDTTTFYPMVDGELSSDPQGEYTGVLLMSPAGNFYDRNDTLIDDLSPTDLSPVNFLRDFVERTDRIGKVSTATGYLPVLLDKYGHEAVTLTFTAKLPAAKVNLANAGDILTVRFSHLTEFETAADIPIIRRVVTQYPGRHDTYLVQYECSAQESTEVGAGGGDPGEVVAPPRGTSHWWEGSFTITGDEADVAGTSRDGFQPDAYYNFQVVIVETPPPVITYATQVYPVIPPGTTAALPTYSGPFTGGGGMFGVGSTGVGGDTTVITGTIRARNFVDPAAVYDMRGTTADGDHSHTHTTSVSFWMDPVEPLTDDPPVAPLPGQPVGPEIPTPPTDGVTTDFATAFAFVQGSLQVFVDNQNETGAVTSSDGEAGTFTLAFAPTSSERITVYYTAAT